MKAILQAMYSEYGKQWDKMSDLEQIASIASFLKNYIALNKKIILL